MNLYVPAAYIRQWNILGAGYGVAGAWDSIVYAVIQKVLQIVALAFCRQTC
jgi:hypothetical protein